MAVAAWALLPFSIPAAILVVEEPALNVVGIHHEIVVHISAICGHGFVYTFIELSLVFVAFVVGVCYYKYGITVVDFALYYQVPVCSTRPSGYLL